MSAADLLATLTEAGAVLSVEEGRLVLDAPANRLTTELEAAIMRHKPALLALLDPASRPATPQPISLPVCVLCAPAPTLDGPALPQRTAVCVDCALRFGTREALALADLRRIEGRLTATHRREHGAWRRLPSSAELHASIAAARRKRQQGRHDDAAEDHGEEEALT